MTITVAATAIHTSFNMTTHPLFLAIYTSLRNALVSEKSDELSQHNESLLFMESDRYSLGFSVDGYVAFRRHLYTAYLADVANTRTVQTSRCVKLDDCLKNEDMLRKSTDELIIE